MRLIIFSGLPGTGKSTLAETLGKELGIPVFAKDWLEATLVKNGLKPSADGQSLGFVGYELMTVLAKRQFMLEQSVILDSVAGLRSIQAAWSQLADYYGANLRVIECICSDESVHRSRLEDRRRNIPGWYELEWSEVERVKAYYCPWEGERLLLDMVQSFDENLLRARKYCE